MTRRIRIRSKRHEQYTQIPEDKVPAHIQWTRGTGRPGLVHYYSLGKQYKKVVDETTPWNPTMYFRKIEDDSPPATPADKIDAEPEKPKQVRYRLGCQCWFVDTDKSWFLCQVTNRGPKPAARITIKPVTGWNADHTVPWPYGDELEFPAHDNNRLFQRLRPLKARTP